MTASRADLRIGIDMRPALLGGTGVGRMARETWHALSRRDDVLLAGWGGSWARPREDRRIAGVATPRLPGRLVSWLAPLGFGVESLLGPLDVFQHTDLVFPPVRSAREVLFVHDVLFLHGKRWHGDDFARDVGRRLARACARAAAVIVPSAATASDELLRAMLPTGVPIVCATPGLEHVDSRPRADDEARLAAALAGAGVPRRPGDEALIVVPGTREPRKNQLTLVRAFLSLPSAAGSRLVLAGPPGWMVPDLEDLLRDEGACRDDRGERRVVALGEVSEDLYAVLLRRADIVAYPSFAEGFGLPVGEAMACGRAVLTSRDTPMAALGGDAVVAVDPHDQAALAEGLARLLDDAEGRRALGLAAAERVAACTWDSHAEALVDVYRQVLS